MRLTQVSIHAPAGGATSRNSGVWKAPAFQSTLPRGERRRSFKCCWGNSLESGFREPCGFATRFAIGTSILHSETELRKSVRAIANPLDILCALAVRVRD